MIISLERSSRVLQKSGCVNEQKFQELKQEASILFPARDVDPHFWQILVSPSDEIFRANQNTTGAVSTTGH